MFPALLTIIASALLCIVLGVLPRWAVGAKYAAMLGAGAALAVALMGEGIEGALLGADIEWPATLEWLGATVFRSDALGAGLGAWCLLLGGLCIVKMASDGEAAVRLSVALLITATLYALAHTADLIALASEVALLVGLVWAYHSTSAAGPAASMERTGSPVRQMFALGMGAAMLLGAVTLMGRASGGIYAIAGVPLPAMSVWPLLLLAGFVLLWLGCAPLTGWSAGASGAADGGFAALVQSLVLGVPVVVLVLRLQALLSSQTLAGALPSGWSAFMGLLGWAGAVTALAGAAGALLYVGAPRFMAMLAAHWLGMTVWALGLDTPLGRYAAVALLIAWGAGRVTWALTVATIQREAWGVAPLGIAAMSLAALPLGAGFVAVWLLGAALTEWGRPALVLLLVGAVAVGACGVVLHLGSYLRARGAGRARVQYAEWAAVGLASAVAAGGVLPGLWLPFVGRMAGVAGGTSAASVSWVGVRVAEGVELPLVLPVLGALLLAALGWAVVRVARLGTHRGSALLPTALDHLRQGGSANGGDTQPNRLASLLSNPPTPVRWLSLAWLEDAILLVGRAVARLFTRMGGLLERLEGRYYLPLALVFTLVLLLAVTR